MGLNPIEYKPWTGTRTEIISRMTVISQYIIRRKIRSIGILLVILMGLLIAFIYAMIAGILVSHEDLDPDMIRLYLGNGLFLLLGVLLVSLTTSDLISEDWRSNAFVLYFSRALRTRDYIAGKMGGALGIMMMFFLLPPTVVALIIMSTQTGNDYGGSIGVLLKTIGSGFISSMLFLPFGLFMSSLTKNKAYAGVGTFMSFFVMTIIGDIFGGKWVALSPLSSLSMMNDVIFGADLPNGISSGLVSGVLLVFFIAPLVVLYYRIQSKAVGK